MITLRAFTPKPRWEDLPLRDGQAIRVEITPPDYGAMIRARVTGSVAASVLTRLECVTNWQGVMGELPNGGRQELPFSREALAQLLRHFPEALAELLRIIRPLFDGLPEDERKNSSAPLDAATPLTPPSTATASSGTLAASPTP